MKLLYMCFDSFPYHGACTSLLKNLFTQKDLRELGEIHVLAIAEDSDVPPYEVIDGICIHRFVSISRMTMKGVLRQFLKNPAKSLSEICFRARKHLPKSFSRNNHFYSDICVKEAVDALEKILNTESFDIIIPMSGLYTAAVASMIVCKKHNIKMGFYQVDPCSTNQVISASTYEERLNFEKEIYGFAKFVITTPIIYEEMKGIAFEERQNKVWKMEFPNVKIDSGKKDKKPCKNIKCLFTGKIYPGARDPNFTLKLFSKLTDSNIKFELIGVNHDELTRYSDIDMSSNIVCRGGMPLDKTKKEIAGADILINIGNKVANQVPSKLFEYIASGKPIVNICVSRTCPTIPYMERYPYALNLFQTNEDEELTRQAVELEKFIHENAGKSVPSDQILSLFQECTPKYCAALMANIIKNSL